MPTFKNGDPIYIIHRNGFRLPGKVSHRRMAYGEERGGTYMVDFDNPGAAEHNQYAEDMHHMPTFNNGDRFWIKKNNVRLYGKVLYRRTPYGEDFGGTYMVKFDKPDAANHNQYAINMHHVTSTSTGARFSDKTRFQPPK